MQTQEKSPTLPRSVGTDSSGMSIAPLSPDHSTGSRPITPGVLTCPGSALEVVSSPAPPAQPSLFLSCPVLSTPQFQHSPISPPRNLAIPGAPWAGRVTQALHQHTTGSCVAAAETDLHRNSSTGQMQAPSTGVCAQVGRLGKGAPKFFILLVKLWPLWDGKWVSVCRPVPVNWQWLESMLESLRAWLCD